MEILRKAHVLQRLKISRSTLKRLIETGSFPASVQVTEGVFGWKACDIDAWIDSLPPTDLKSA